MPQHKSAYGNTTFPGYSYSGTDGQPMAKYYSRGWYPMYNPSLHNALSQAYGADLLKTTTSNTDVGEWVVKIPGQNLYIRIRDVSDSNGLRIEASGDYQGTFGAAVSMRSVDHTTGGVIGWNTNSAHTAGYYFNKYGGILMSVIVPDGNQSPVWNNPLDSGATNQIHEVVGWSLLRDQDGAIIPNKVMLFKRNSPGYSANRADGSYDDARIHRLLRGSQTQVTVFDSATGLATPIERHIAPWLFHPVGVVPNALQGALYSLKMFCPISPYYETALFRAFPESMIADGKIVPGQTVQDGTFKYLVPIYTDYFWNRFLGSFPYTQGNTRIGLAWEE